MAEDAARGYGEVAVQGEGGVMTKTIDECIQMATLLFPLVEKVELSIGHNTEDWHVSVVDGYDGGEDAAVSSNGDTVEAAIQQLHRILTSQCADLTKKLAEHVEREPIP